MYHYGYKNAKPYGHDTKKHGYAAHANGHDNTNKHYGTSYFGQRFIKRSHKSKFK